MSKQIATYLKSKGTFNKVELLDRKHKENDLRFYHYRVYFSKEEVELFITLTKDNKK